MPDDLLEAAFTARLNAYCPYSGFAVGAALRTDDGRIMAGANVENAAHPQGQCAEASAIGAMVSQGAKRIVEVLVLADSEGVISPCGGCRQRLAEFADAATLVHLAGPEGVRRTVTLGELLPLGFGPAHLGSEDTARAPAASARLRTLPGATEARIAIQLGSGLSGLVDLLEAPSEVAYAELPGFPVPTTPGHGGRVVAGRLGGVPVLCLEGRAHLYEGIGAAAVTGPVRALKDVGVRLLVLTNAAGAIAPELAPGDLVLLSDHVNALGHNPLIGRNDDQYGPRFLDMSDAYDPELRARVKSVAAEMGVPLAEGVYLATLGPSFETPAEIRAFAAMGADLVGMSTVPEAIAARHAGLRVLGFSVVTNKAAGLAEGVLSHDETLRVGTAAGARLAALLAKLVGELHDAL